MTPPRLSKPFQDVPSHHLCQTAESVPRTTTSIRLAAHDTALGREVRMPPRFSQPFHFCDLGSTTPCAVQNGNSESMPASPYAILKNPPSPHPAPHEFLQIQQCSASE